MRRGGACVRVYARYAAEVLVTSRWNSESVGSLSVEELRQLRENAVRLGAGDVAGLCDSALAAHGPQASSGASSSRRENSKLVPRRSAFRMRGVHLNAGMSSWGGVRPSDGVVVLSSGRTTCAASTAAAAVSCGQRTRRARGPGRIRRRGRSASSTASSPWRRRGRGLPRTRRATQGPVARRAGTKRRGRRPGRGHSIPGGAARR